MRSSYPGPASRVTSGRLPIVVFGDSDAAQSYVHASNCAPTVRGIRSGIEFACHMYCHQGEGNDAVWITKNTIGPMEPVLGSGILRGSWLLDLGEKLEELGVPATFLSYAHGGTNFGAYRPIASAEYGIWDTVNYETRNAWVLARLAEMPNHQEPVLLTDQGMAGIGASNVWDIEMTILMAALRRDLGCPSMRVVQVRCPAGFGWAMIGQQNYYASTDPLCKLAWNDTMTFVDDNTLAQGQLGGIHFDAPSSRKLAIGPDDATTQSVVTALQQLGVI